MSTEHRMFRDILDQPRSLEAVLAAQSGSALSDAAALIRNAGRIVVTGMGASLYSGMSLAYRLSEAGLPCVTIDAGELLHHCGEVARGAVVVLVSRSGETVEAVRLLPLLRPMNARIIGVTNEPGTTIARESDVAVLVNSGRDEAVAVQTYTGSTMALLLLAAAATGRDVSAQATHAISRMAEAIAGAQQQSPDSFETTKVIYVLGRGPSLASAHEAALLFNETAKLPSVAMSAGNFRHGAIEVVDSNFRAFLFASDPRTRELDEALATHLTRMKARVQIIAVEPSYFAPLIEIVPLQFAAYHAALQRGFTPGAFRHVSVVTTSETEF